MQKGRKLMKKDNFSKVKTTFMVNGLDLHAFKEKAKMERTTPSILVGQFIRSYISKEGVTNV